MVPVNVFVLFAFVFAIAIAVVNASQKEEIFRQALTVKWLTISARFASGESEQQLLRNAQVTARQLYENLQTFNMNEWTVPEQDHFVALLQDIKEQQNFLDEYRAFKQASA